MFFMSKIQNENRIIFSIIRIIVSILVVILCVFVLFKIYDFVYHYPFLENIKVKNNAPSISITVDSPNSDSMFITDDKGLRFRKEDKSFAREEWIEKNAELFYFDTNSYGYEGDMKLDGQIYSFEKGKLKKIQKDKTYSAAVNPELFNSIDSPQYLVYLVNDENENGAFPIKYHRYGDDVEDYLGTQDDKQYCSTNMLKINFSNIYFLALTGKNKYRNKLYRMRPNAQNKETVGTNVEGYIVLSDDVVYYYDGNVIMKAKNWDTESVKYKNEDDLFSDALNSLPIDNGTPIEPTEESGLAIETSIEEPGANETEPTKESKDSKESIESVEVKIVDSPNNLAETSKGPAPSEKVVVNDKSEGPRITRDISEPTPMPIN